MAASVAADGEAEEEEVRHVGCFCGAVSMRVVGPPSMGASFCHCSICRRLSGAPFSANGLWPGSAVTVENGDDQLQPLQTSKSVTRVRCSACGGPVMAKINKGKIVVLPLPIFPPETVMNDPRFRPHHHIHYGSRCMDVSDDLPKYVSSARGALFKQDEIAQPESPEAST